MEREVNGVVYVSRPEPAEGDPCADCVVEYDDELCEALHAIGCGGVIWLRAESKDLSDDELDTIAEEYGSDVLGAMRAAVAADRAKRGA